MTTIAKTIGRDLPNGDYVEIHAEAREGDPRGLSDGFSATITGWEKRGTWSGRAAKRNGRDARYGGADHETLLSIAPELAPIVRAHLADLDGTPMHAEANGWYFYKGEGRAYEDRAYGPEYAKRHGSDHERAARALHIAPEDLPTDLDREGFAAFCASLREKWARQADDARSALAAMVDGEGVE